MPFRQTIPVNDLVQLTSLTEDDVQWLVKNGNDREIYENTLTFPYPYLEVDGKKFIRMMDDYYQKNNVELTFAIRLLENNEVIGGIGLLNNFGPDSHRSEIGYWLAKAYRKKKIMTEALNVFCEYCFTERKLVRLEANAFEHNIPSQKLLLKCGFQQEGFLKKAFLKDGKYLNAVFFAKVV